MKIMLMEKIILANSSDETYGLLSHRNKRKVINDCKSSTWILTDEHLETTPKKLVEFSCSRRTTIIHAKL
jgi:hypothetical protein